MELVKRVNKVTIRWDETFNTFVIETPVKGKKNQTVGEAFLDGYSFGEMIPFGRPVRVLSTVYKFVKITRGYAMILNNRMLVIGATVQFYN